MYWIYGVVSTALSTFIVFFKQKPAYEMRISDWSSDVCSSDLQKFIEKYGLTVPLASDEDGVALAAFGTWVEKSMYGRTYMGIDRSTFLFDADGKLVRAWRKVRVPGHVEDVLEAVRALAR